MGVVKGDAGSLDYSSYKRPLKLHLNWRSEPVATYCSNLYSNVYIDIDMCVYTHTYIYI